LPTSAFIERTWSSRKPEPRTQEIIFLRDHGLGAGPSLAIVDVNREPVASVEKGERVSVWLPPGNYRVGVRQGLDESSTVVRSELELKVERQMQYAFRIRYGTRFELLPLDRVAVGTGP
jgi:hypothetical protein